MLPKPPAPVSSCLVTGIGAVTSVGRTAPSSCAAIRAGIARPRKVTGFRVVDEETQAPIPLVGHPVKGVTDGFGQLGSWIQLARICLADLRQSAQLPSSADQAFWENTGLWLVTPYANDEVFLTAPGTAPQYLQRYAERLTDTLHLPISARRTILVSRAHAGTAAALQHAMGQLATGLDRALVLAVDSLLDSISLQRLAGAGRLKTPDFPTGLIPGEAGAGLLLEHPSSARRRGVAPQAVLMAATTGQEVNTLRTEKPNTGAGLAACISDGLERGLGNAAFTGDIYLDLNGEVWRAQEWGSALARLGKRLSSVTTEMPAVCVGDTGAASGALGVCLAVQGFVRGQASGSNALVVSSAEGGELGCVLVSPPPSARA